MPKRPSASSIETGDAPTPPTNDIWRGWFDGATDPNPGKRGIGALLLAPDGRRFEISEAIGHGTSNEAEYEALLALLRLALTHDMAHLTLCGDSQLVVKQVLGEWACQSVSLRPLSIEARRLMRELLARGTVKLSWIPREQNMEADVLSVRALGVIRETPEQTAQWVTQTQIGKALDISAVAVGKKLDALGYRVNKRPTAVALEHGLARIKEDHFGQHISWHLTKTVHTLQGEGER